MKPHIKRDLWHPTGYICFSYYKGVFGFRRRCVGTGDTIGQAYFNWEFKRIVLALTGAGPLC